MFNIGMGEIILILLVAFVIVGPQDLPRVAQFLGRIVRKGRIFVCEIKEEVGWADIRKEFEDASNMAGTVSREVKNTAEEVRTEMNAAGAEFQKGSQVLQEELRSLNMTGKANGGNEK